jgi:hypothetical protein
VAIQTQKELNSEKPDLLDEIADVLDFPDAWLDAHNEHLGYRTPRELLGTDREPEVWNLIRMIKQGAFT